MKNCLKEKVSQLSVLYKVFSTFFVVKALQLATMDVPQWKVIEVAAILNEISKRYMETHKIYFLTLFHSLAKNEGKWGKTVFPLWEAREVIQVSTLTLLKAWKSNIHTVCSISMK